MLRTELARDHTFLARFRREAQSAAGLNHASIVAVYDHGEDELTETGGAAVKVPYIVMEYVDGQTLRAVITERGHLEPTEALRITEGVLDALAYSHRNGIVHRDIKPANVMIATDGTIKVMDFGIARAMADANATMTQTSAVIGTAQYLSPEQAQGQPVDERSDLYSTGCMLFELLTGRPPFLGESPVSIAYQHVGEQPMPPSRLVEGLSEDLDAVVLHSLAKPRDARYQTADQFRTDLQAVRLGRPISDAARGSTAALAGAAAGAAVVGATAATEALPALGAEPTQAYVAAAPPDLPPEGTDTLAGLGEEPGRKRGAGGWIVLALVALAAIAALVYGLSTYFGEDDVPQVAVPDVVGDPRQTAIAKIAQAGLEAETVTQASDTEPADTVISQNPTAATEVPRGSTVRLFISTGPTAVTVPDLRGTHRRRGDRAALRPGARGRHGRRGRRPRDREGQDHRLQPGAQHLGGARHEDHPARRQRQGEGPQRRRQVPQRGRAPAHRRQPPGRDRLPPDELGAGGAGRRAGPGRRHHRDRRHREDRRARRSRRRR